MFNMSTDSHLFRSKEQLEEDGWQLRGNLFERDGELYVPLYEGKMIHHFDHRWATYENGKFRAVTPEEKQDPSFLPMPRYWVSSELVKPTPQLLSFRDVTNTTNRRTSIWSVLPPVAAGHSLPVSHLEPEKQQVFVSLMSSFIFDYVSRLKVGGSHLTLFILAQLPVLLPVVKKEPTPWEQGIALPTWLGKRAEELALTSWTVADPPFIWHEVRRSIIIAELDAAIFHLYGIERDDVEYILGTFLGQEKQEMEEFGEYRTKRLILEVYDKMAEAIEQGRTYESPLSPPPGDPSLRHDPATRPDWADLYEQLRNRGNA